jgi:hypothetical protein
MPLYVTAVEEVPVYVEAMWTCPQEAAALAERKAISRGRGAVAGNRRNSIGSLEARIIINHRSG